MKTIQIGFEKILEDYQEQAIENWDEFRKKELTIKEYAEKKERLKQTTICALLGLTELYYFDK